MGEERVWFKDFAFEMGLPMDSRLYRSVVPTSKVARLHLSQVLVKRLINAIHRNASNYNMIKPVR